MNNATSPFKLGIFDSYFCISNIFFSMGQKFHKFQKPISYSEFFIQGDPPQKKNRTHIFLTEIHKFNPNFFFFSQYEVDSVHEKLGP